MNKKLYLQIFSISLLILLIIASYNNGFDIKQFALLIFTIIFNLALAIVLFSLPNNIWYKKMILNRFKNKTINLTFIVYDEKLNKYKVNKEFKIIDYFVTDNQNLVFKANSNNTYIHFIGGLISKCIKLSDRFGKSYKYDKFQISSDDKKFKLLYREIEQLKIEIPNLLNISENSKKWTIDPNSFYINHIK